MLCLRKARIMIHYMKLYDSPFQMIKKGEKTIELRLNDEKRRKVKTGDTIVFKNIVSGEEVSVMVLNIYPFRSFEKLYENLPLDKCGYSKDEIPSPSHMDKYYSKDMQYKYGVIGIEIKIIK